MHAAWETGKGGLDCEAPRTQLTRPGQAAQPSPAQPIPSHPSPAGEQPSPAGPFAQNPSTSLPCPFRPLVCLFSLGSGHRRGSFSSRPPSSLLLQNAVTTQPTLTYNPTISLDRGPSAPATRIGLPPPRLSLVPRVRRVRSLPKSRSSKPRPSVIPVEPDYIINYDLFRPAISIKSGLLFS
ncbi:hypothetical protein B0T24DRAFT_201688 [Lasiosphaeria ovina]|uniref:Uncharacterized protein n=1 Tax=Lasiosphaeria ovina TaxID=92902 RepID=A0AAE0JRU4_9PEZI|nr:hypothetical protein B0T24DRAFT_201688 [Lasiosphaeria ovina]